jgi:uncharacterized protein (DUF2062 family)
MENSFIRRRAIDPLVAILKFGVTPEKIAISLALGIVLGVFPVLGSTTILCAGAAVALGLNLPAIQLINYVMYPVQLMLLIPFMRLGEKLFRMAPLPLSLVEITAMIHADRWQALRALWTTTVHAMAAWLLVSAPAAALLYAILVPVMRTVWRAEVAPAFDRDGAAAGLQAAGAVENKSSG